MTLLNILATTGLGKKQDVIKQGALPYGQAKLLINANPLNGNLFVEDFTQTFIAQGFQFDIGYRYNSQSKQPWSLNQGKTIGLIQGQPNEEGSYVAVEESDGHVSTYTYDLAYGRYVNLSEAGGSSTLTYTPEGKGHWIGWNPLTNIHEAYDKKNRLEKITNSSGNFLRYAYDDSGRLTEINGQADQKVVIAYGIQTASIDFVDGGQRMPAMRYIFDNKNRIIQTTIVSNQNYNIDYSYFENSDCLKAITQSDRTQVAFEYNESNQLNVVRDGAGTKQTFSYAGNTTQLTDFLDNSQVFTKNEDGLLQRYALHDQYKEYHYDAYKRIESIKYQDDTIEQFSYDPLGCYSKLVTRNNETSLFKHDAETGLLLCETQVSGTAENPTTVHLAFRTVYKILCRYEVITTDLEILRLPYINNPIFILKVLISPRWRVTSIHFLASPLA